jgi:hypothetical protein
LLTKNEEFATKKQLLHLPRKQMSYKYAKRLLGLPSIPAEFREEYETTE